MRSLLVILLSCLTISCSAETPPKPEPKLESTIQLEKIEVVHVVQPPVKPSVQPTTKKVCIMVYDSTLKKNVQKCRTIKIYKKYKGTPVPEKKK